ncbi:MAG TPA: ferrochelatase [Caulobacteraceae bacterium]|jgi:ferrochelatase|nr:ferrochelatase [Caulobacteraceae bacterium]
MSRIAVVLLNLGGPDGPAAVRPFLKNLFSDPAIIAGPGVVRLGLAELISRIREKSAVANYAVMGGGSPLNAETKAQAAALQAALGGLRPGDQLQVFVAMRYWSPLTEETAAEVARFRPDEVVLLPLYPQFSTTTTASSLAAWRAHYDGPGRSHTVCCYSDQDALAEAHAELIDEAWKGAGSPPNVRLLFSAHGIPQRTSDAGDPYRSQVERTCAAVAAKLARPWDWRICYQSQVGPMKWIGPSTIEEIERAAADGLGVVIDPIAFVSEHVETLVELDRDYAELARKLGVSPYIRVPALGVQPRFIEGLAELVEAALASAAVAPGATPCDAGHSRCALRTLAA